MGTFRWELFRYLLPLKKPLRLLGYEFRERKGLILRFYRGSSENLSTNIFGEGEIVTLPGIHTESFNLAEKQIRDYLSSGNETNYKPKLNLFPSVNFGLDMAMRTLFNNLKKSNHNQNIEKKDEIDTTFQTAGINCFKIPVNGLLIGSGSMFELECKRLRDDGYQAIKIKVGQLTVKEDLKRVKLARKILGDKIDLRLDANRLWEWDEALEFAKSASEFGIQYCEEPLRDIRKIEKLYEETKIPLALDETLWKNPSPETLPKKGIKAFILKPCILGGWDKTRFWIDYAEKKDIQVVLSSSFESGLGLNWIAFIAKSLIKKQIPIGIDTAKWFKHDLIDPPFVLKNGYYIIPDSWPKAKFNYLEQIEEGTWIKPV